MKTLTVEKQNKEISLQKNGKEVFSKKRKVTFKGLEEDLICDNCKNKIQDYQHYFEIISNHPEPMGSYDCRSYYFHAECLEGLNLYNYFEWHRRGLY